ncbi:hypothetical protein E2320_004726 [Naja naja]|nr:hypothetical protein E2320_004726 [Naja naja]
MKSYRSPYVIPDFSLSCFLWKVIPRLLCIFSVNMLNISAFRIHRVENTDNCQDHTIYSWPTFVLEGEPTVLKCLQFKNTNSFDLSLNLTWKKKDPSGIIPIGFKGPRIMSQGDAVWLLPTILQDSGEYICTQRNSSYCTKVSMHLKVVKRNETNNISYPQKAFLLSSGKIVCPNLENFIQNNTNYELKWYKDSTRLNMDNKKFTALEGTNYLLINPISMNDSGYYTCEMTFAFEKEQYKITRTVQLQILEKKKKNIPVIVNPNERITSVALGMCVQFVENNNRSIEVQLIFDSITEADFHTDFRCVAQIVGGNHVQTVTVKEKKKDRELSWYLAVTPVALAVLIIGGIYLSKYWKQRSIKGYVVASS